MVCLLVSFGGGVLAGVIVGWGKECSKVGSGGDDLVGVIVERGKECSKVGSAGDGLVGVVEEHRHCWGMGVGVLRQWGLRLGESFVVRGYGIVESVQLGWRGTRIGDKCVSLVASIGKCSWG
jgi:hypothetical protein